METSIETSIETLIENTINATLQQLEDICVKFIDLGEGSVGEMDDYVQNLIDTNPQHENEILIYYIDRIDEAIEKYYKEHEASLN